MAGNALGALYLCLLNKKEHEKITREEANVFADWRSQTIKTGAVGSTVASGLTWIATRKWRTVNRIIPIAGAAFLTFGWTYGKSIDSCVDRILQMDGSRMQYELKKIILERYGNDPEKMKPFSKHFYCEEIFTDSTTGRPKSIYRQRHLYVDDPRTTDGSTNEFSKKGVNRQQRNDDSNIKLKSSGAETKQVPIHSGVNILGHADPLGVLFGNSSPNEEPYQLEESGNSAKVPSHSQRRARRRRRLRHRHQESLPLEGS